MSFNLCSTVLYTYTYICLYVKNVSDRIGGRNPTTETVHASALNVRVLSFLLVSADTISFNWDIDFDG